MSGAAVVEEDLRVRHLSVALLLPTFLAGCAGYAADYWKPKESLIGRQLPRYGLAGEREQCVGSQLTKSLSVWQLRQLADVAARLQPSPGGILSTRDLAYVAGLVADPKVGPEVSRVLDVCGATAATVAATPAQPATPQTGIVGTPPTPLRWIELGTAETGQAIAIDIATVTMKGNLREGWFRLSDPGAATPSLVGYRLRIDCVARTITPTGARRYNAEGAIAHQEDYSEGWQSALAVEPGTVMEIAHKRVCT